MAVRWHFRMEGALAVTPWDLGDGEPDVVCLASVRSPRSSPRSHHIPVRAWCMTTRSQLHLESGLEHDLVRMLDRLPETTWLVAQPAAITWPVDGSDRSHVPDLLSMNDTGEVTLWDARPTAKQDESFDDAAEVTRQACTLFGWHYRVFAELPTAERLNLLWLHGFRRPPNWLAEARPVIAASFAGEAHLSLSELFARDAGDGCLIAAVWHLIWGGELVADLSRPIQLSTPIRPAIAGER